MGSGPDYLGKNHQPSVPNYLGRDTGVDWRAHEKRTAKRSGGYQQPGSGNQPGKPADVRDAKWLRENKASRNGAEGMFVKGGWLQKIVAHAITRGLNPALDLCFDGQEAPVPNDWVLVPAMEFEELLERAGEKAVGTDD